VSIVGIGAVLTQEGKPIEFSVRNLEKPSKNGQPMNMSSMLF
jgi:hypothetical protein